MLSTWFIFIVGEYSLSYLTSSCKAMLHRSKQYLTHCDLVLPYNDFNLGQHWFMYWLVARRRQIITWNNSDILSIGTPGTSFNEMFGHNTKMSSKKMHFRMSASKVYNYCGHGPQYVNSTVHGRTKPPASILCKFLSLRKLSKILRFDPIKMIKFWSNWGDHALKLWPGCTQVTRYIIAHPACC